MGGGLKKGEVFFLYRLKLGPAMRVYADNDLICGPFPLCLNEFKET